MSAPVQLITIGVDRPEVPDSVLAEFTRLSDSGLVKVLDVIFVQHNEDGYVDSVDRLDADRMQFDGSLISELLTTPDAEGGSDDAPVWSVHDAVPQGQMAALVLVEHTWAGPLVSAMLDSGGRMFDELWLSAEDRQLLASLLAARG